MYNTWKKPLNTKKYERLGKMKRYILFGERKTI